jgi:SLBB domain
MTAHRSLMKIVLLIIVLILAACAPENLDITPTPAPTAVPIIKVYVTGAVNQTGITVELPLGSRSSDAIEAAGGALDSADLQQVNMAQLLRDGDQVNVPAVGDAVVESTPEPEPQVIVSDSRQLLDHILTTVPGSINAGTVSWRRDNSVATNFVDREGGVTARISFNEAGGGLMELTYGVFATPEEALAYYENVRGTLATLERAQERDTFPTPNAFGGGTYGWDAVFVRDNVFIRVSVPRVSSTAGDPLNPMGRQVVTILDEAIASFTPAP